MGFFDKIRDTASQAKEMATKFADDKQLGEKFDSAKDSLKKAIDDTTSTLKNNNQEAKELKKPLEGAICRYEFTYISGLEDIPKAKIGAWGMNVMSDRFAFRVTSTTKDWLYNLDIPYNDISDIRIEKRTITNAEWLLGGGNDANQQQENVVVIEYNDKNGKKSTLRVEMLTGVSIYKQAQKCKELFDILRSNDILDKIRKDENNNTGNDILSQIDKLAKLKAAGVITEEEFTNKKTELLAKL